MHKYYLITNTSKDPDFSFTSKVKGFIEENGHICIAKKDGEEIPEDTECVIVLGGDGSVLRAAAQVGTRQIPILGINLGTLGYLAEVEKKDYKEALLHTFSDEYFIEERMMLKGAVAGGEEHVALNDVVFARSGPLRILNYDVYVNGLFLNSFYSDGIILSTPTGSTAYNLSAGGPIVEPEAKMIVLTPICSHTLNKASVVLSAGDEIQVEIGRTSTGPYLEAEVSFDGSSWVTMHTGDRMTIQKANRVTRLVRLSRRSFLEVLHKKMTG